MMVKVCGRPASRQCMRRKRLHSPWKVPIHMLRTFTGTSAEAGQHLLGGFVGEGDRQHARWPHLPGRNQPGDARGQHPGFAGAGASGSTPKCAAG